MKKILLLCVLTTGLMFAQTNVSDRLDNATKAINSTKDLVVNVKNFQTNNGFVKTGKSATAAVYDDSKNSVATVYGDSKSLVQTVYSDVKSAGVYLTPKVENAISQIAKGLKVGTTYVWNILVKQQKVWSWCYLIGMIIALLAWARFYYTIREGKTDTDSAGQWKNHNVWLSFITLSLAIILSIASFQHIVPMMTGFLNPEFGAMQNIIEVAKTLK